MKERLLLIGLQKEQAEIFADWLEREGYKAELANDPEEIYSLLSRETFDILIIDIDSPETTEALLGLCRTLKSDKRFSHLPISILTYKKDYRRIATAIEMSADSFILKPFEAKSFLSRINTIFREIEIKKQGKKLLDLTYINDLIKLAGQANRKGFFILAPVIFNKLVIEKVRTVFGEPTLMVMIKRLQEIIEGDYKFMRAVKLQNAQILMEEVDRVSKSVPVEKLAIAFKHYVDAFLHLIQTLTSDILIDRGGINME